MSATRLTKRGEPVQGTEIEIRLTDLSYERAKVVGKGWGGSDNHLVLLIVEWSDGGRQRCLFEDLVWRKVEAA